MSQSYEDHVNLIRKFAWSFHRKTGISYDDWISDLNVVFCRALTEYDPKKSVKFSTYLSSCFLNFFKNEMIKKYRLKRMGEEVDIDDFEISSYDPEEGHILLISFLDNPNPVVKSIAKILSIYDFPDTGIRGWLKDILRDSGFKFREIKQGFEVIDNLLGKE